MNPSSTIIVGCLVEKDGKFLLMQEAKASCHGKWNLPAGHLDVGESIFEGAKRETKEETGYNVELTGVCQIGNRKRSDMAFVAVLFTAQVTSDDTSSVDPAEVMAVRWFTYAEILALQDAGKIRNSDLMIGAINNYQQGNVAPLDIVKLYHEGAEFQKVTLKDDA